jgi:hypothetical protein
MSHARLAGGRVSCPSPAGGGVLIAGGDTTVLVGEIGGIDIKGRLRVLRQPLVVLVEIGQREPLLGYVRVRVFDAHLVLPGDSALVIVRCGLSSLNQVIQGTGAPRGGVTAMADGNRRAQRRMWELDSLRHRFGISDTRP